ncbi:MAG: fructose-6-phosphate aldolase [Meiothermus sp.]|uniref:fructose-6-phosphate aldolase n=1 Tax=Meiothermus sp. TaxID=1955249 RepID=UPI0025F6CF8B|nr:fructose-6-phosphate aldolase [Meiothermus sp.]MCS7058317.1 fructose-6-phosphate aldolase [Meiothermus sp.]MCS7194816.1 fructose-6-phosphate aldolase [Meiothermus sp.]MCX7740979.1 fructose-6-phosphate aldolase [Meiothermus sp.]MDW8090348.1 fructose-6-phosphate aldolase [Meiothermus sp.]MDW8481153.1 fructose-6-phosphate aldolase [Meiothermus sp.]
MDLYLDTAELSEIREIAAWGVLSGVTTNPSLIAKTGRPLEPTIKEICQVVQGPVSAEVVATSAPEMIAEGRRLAGIDPHVVVKLPTTVDGLKACKALSSEGVRVNMTLVFSPNQALLCAKAGAWCVSPFLGRIDDISWDGMGLIREIAEIYRVQGISTRILAASIRHPRHVTEAARMGAQIATMPARVFQQLIKHPLTEAGLEAFLRDWARASASF